MIRRILLSLLLLGAAMRADAGYYTDIWYKISEPGWGVNLVQSDNFMFATFFIYGLDGTPTWYTAELFWDGVSSYKGDVFANHGTFFGVPWNNSTQATVGKASFTPSTDNAYKGVLAYQVDNVGSASNTIQRQTLTPIAFGGSYIGGEVGAATGCTAPGNNFSYALTYGLAVSYPSSATVAFEFEYDNGLSCRLFGAFQQNGLLYSIPNARYTCSDGLDTTAIVSEIKATSQGIEGRYFAPSIGSGCAESGSFSAVFLSGS